MLSVLVVHRQPAGINACWGQICLSVRGGDDTQRLLTPAWTLPSRQQAARDSSLTVQALCLLPQLLTGCWAHHKGEMSDLGLGSRCVRSCGLNGPRGLLSASVVVAVVEL